MSSARSKYTLRAWVRAWVRVQNDEQVDLIAVMFGTFQHMYTNDDALRAMKSIARNLKPGGLFVLEFSHPALLFDGSVVSSADTWSHEVEDAQVEVCRLAPKIASSRALFRWHDESDSLFNILHVS